jgi:hypothetical protein
MGEGPQLSHDRPTAVPGMWPTPPFVIPTSPAFPPFVAASSPRQVLVSRPASFFSVIPSEVEGSWQHSQRSSLDDTSLQRDPRSLSCVTTAICACQKPRPWPSTTSTFLSAHPACFTLASQTISNGTCSGFCIVWSDATRPEQCPGRFTFSGWPIQAHLSAHFWHHYTSSNESS